jgi:hypothetical protein
MGEGNLVEARRAFATYRELISDELGILPSRELANILHPQLAIPSRPMGSETRTSPVWS